MFDRIVLTCEHAVNRIPAPYRSLFIDARNDLHGHRGYDAGALEIARALAGAFGAPLFTGEASRLLVDLNRSLGHPRLFSEYLDELGEAERLRILGRYYRPYRARVEAALVEAALVGASSKEAPGKGREAGAGTRGRVLHLSIHSFVPILDGRRRQADIGLLYDPGRARERETCVRLRSRLRSADPTLRIRRNYPYRGTSDGLTTHFRKVFAPDRYAGIEIEVNQSAAASKRDRTHMSLILEGAIRPELG